MADQDKTALQLAEEIAERVMQDVGNSYQEFAIGTIDGDCRFMDVNPGSRAEAVLSVLREHGVWFCRLTETPEGTVQERLPMGDEDV